MIRSIKSELLKFFTTRMWWGMAIAIVLAGAGFALLFGFIFTSDAATSGQKADRRRSPTTSTWPARCSPVASGWGTCSRWPSAS